MRVELRPLWAVLSLWSVALTLHAGASPPAAARQDEVRARGAHVMPFTLARTQHHFETTTDGGRQRVLARAGAADEVPAIRDHLRDIAERFRRRDFSGPAHIHGDDMPGLAVLRAAAPDALSVEYRELPEGAEVHYRGADPRTVAAIHDWFAAQLADHGHDATGHAHHHHHGEPAPAD